MSEALDSSPEKAPTLSRRRTWILLALAALAVVAAVAWWAGQTSAVADTFRTAIQQRDAPSLVRLARLVDRPDVLERAKTIWQLCSPADAESGPLPSGACRVDALPPSLWDRLTGRRDLLVLAVDPETGRAIDVFYYRIRANRLKAGAVPQKFDELEARAGRLLASP